MSASDEPSMCIPCGVKRWDCHKDGPPCKHCSNSPLSMELCSYEWTLTDRLFAVFGPQHNLTGRLQIPASETTQLHFGGFGEVRKVTCAMGVVAVKTLRMPDSGLSRILQLSVREAWTWTQLEDHPNIVPFLGIADYEKVADYNPGRAKLCLVSKWIAGGDIIKYGEKHPNTDKFPLLVDVASGLEYLHSKKIIHGDLKGNNILIDLAEGAPRARLTDFGLSYLEASRAEFDHNASGTSESGAARWLAFERRFPDKYNVKGYVEARSEKSDIFEMMRTFLEVLTGQKPYPELTQGYQVEYAISQGINPSKPAINLVSDDMWAFMNQSWSPDRDLRPSIAEIKRFVASKL